MKLLPFMLLAAITTMFVSSCSGDTDKPSASVDVEQYENGGDYTGRLEKEENTNQKNK